MRLDKLTTKFQEALADAQSLALGHDHAYIQPEHLLSAMLLQEDGPRSLLARAGVNVAALAQGIDAAVKRVRRKFQDVHPGEDPIETVYGLGYKLRHVEA